MRRSKFGAIRTTVDGITFASKKEARCYQELKLREKAGEIRHLELQPRYRLEVNGVKVCDYVGDFRFVEVVEAGKNAEGNDWFSVTGPIVADAKGVRTPIFALKAKLMKAIYGIEIVEL